MGLVNNDRILAGRQMILADLAAFLIELVQLLAHEGKLLQSSDDDRHTILQGLGELARILINLLHHALTVIELVNRVL